MTGRVQALRRVTGLSDVDLVVRQTAERLWWSLGRLRAWIKGDIRHVYYPLLIIFFAVFLFHPGGRAKQLDGLVDHADGGQVRLCGRAPPGAALICRSV